MTAKHRKGKSNHRPEENSSSHSAVEPEPQGGGSHSGSVCVLFLLFVAGGATAAWFCFQQHQTVASLTDSVERLQSKLAQMENVGEQLREANEKLSSITEYEQRLSSLEETHILIEKRINKATLTMDHALTSDLPSKLSILQAQIKMGLDELKEAAAPKEELRKIQDLVELLKTTELELLQRQLNGIMHTSSELRENVDSFVWYCHWVQGRVGGLEESAITHSLALEEVREEAAKLDKTLQALAGSAVEMEAKLDRHAELLSTLTSQLEEQGKEVLSLKESEANQRAEMVKSEQELANVRKVVQVAQAQRASLDEELNSIRQELTDQSRQTQNRTQSWDPPLRLPKPESTRLRVFPRLASRGDTECQTGTGAAGEQTEFFREVEARCGEECTWPLLRSVSFPKPVARLPVITVGLAQASLGVTVKVSDHGHSGFTVQIDRVGEPGPTSAMVSWMACA
ncbi:inhibitor of nuclear factor kappa-B kinase-interacting protein-like [Acipenser oxyrinchus oxyrinchus]|uniref:Inhibitor of nuclear factor kappa-B kinase-interacting protein-like n=1 Tax=Acipenser oxyrinchus oxyrinchus TaxID=40147 RepID=A0AAD8CEH1_ACIOX|nr:inhibitor of nuclear factor kappa-B kinase-interacting protein-like [Acipenser oxyrinchus oxyrinchus]